MPGAPRAPKVPVVGHYSWQALRQGGFAWGLALILLLSVPAAGRGARFIDDEDKFPGWRGELPDTSLPAQGSNASGRLPDSAHGQLVGSQAARASTQAAGPSVSLSRLLWWMA